MLIRKTVAYVVVDKTIGEAHAMLFTPRYTDVICSPLSPTLRLGYVPVYITSIQRYWGFAYGSCFFIMYFTTVSGPR